MAPPSFRWRSRLLLVLAVALLAPGGCGGLRNSSLRRASACDQDSWEPAADNSRNYSDCLSAAGRLENQSDARCVDWFYAAARVAWREAHGPGADPTCPDSWSDYNFALSELLRTGQRFGRLDARHRLVVQQGNQVTEIPVVHHGFTWSAADFQRLLAPPHKHQRMLQRRYACRGVGTPVVVERHRCDADPIESQFYPPRSWFAATAVLRFDQLLPIGSAAQDKSSVVLEFYDPLRVKRAALECGELRLANDLSAPLAVALDESPSTYLAGFLRPSTGDTTARLSFTEPLRRDRIPLVLIHGLYSDEQCWADLLNDLRLDPVFVERFQVWWYRYPTGDGFLQSAAKLRDGLRTASALGSPPVNVVSTSCWNDRLQQMVLVGHSMGGLVAKLQVTHSEDRIWCRIANQPIDAILTTPETRALLLRACFFEPVPQVRRVVFIATPHGGASSATGLMGRGASYLVHTPAEIKAQHEQLIRDNPGVFSDYVTRKFPTSVDLLEPSSPLLSALREMQFKPDVRLHNIAGDGVPITLSGPSDGLVPLNSAFHPGCLSEMRLRAVHTAIHRHATTSTEILRILGQHLQEMDAASPGP